MWYIPSGNTTPEDQLGSTIVAALYELYLSVDKISFNKLRDSLISLFVEKIGPINLGRFFDL
jgi:hypothetical protein